MTEQDPPRDTKLKGLLWLAAILALTAAAALGFSNLVRLIPYAVEDKIATALPDGQFGAPCGTRAGAKALEKLVARLYPLETGEADRVLRIEVVREKDVNAFASLGGRIFVNRGLLDQAESAEELAGVLAHEIEHVRKRHVLEGLIVKLGTVGLFQILIGSAGGGSAAGETIGFILGMQYGKKQEQEADEGGLKRLVRAEISTRGFRNFFDRAAKEGGKLTFLSDHPSDQKRADRAREYEGLPSRPILETSEWFDLRGICGENAR